MKIAIGTENKSKIKALRESIEKCVYFKGTKNIEIISKSVESGVSDMPISLEENILGATNRANNLRKDGFKADYYIGMEGGVTKIGNKSYLFGVVYILNNSLKAHLGITPFLEVPKYFDERIYEKGMDLGEIQGQLSNDRYNNHKNGSFGEWTNDMINRSDSFEQAFLCAISPFYNKYYFLK